MSVNPTLARYSDIFDRKAFATLATVGRDGSPQATPVWCDFDGTCVRVNTARGRVKEQNVLRDPRVALTVLDPDNPYRYLQIRGRVVETVDAGADAHIDALAQKYLGLDRYPWRRPGEARVILRIAPDHVQALG